MCNRITGVEKPLDRIDALVYALSMLNLNAYVGSYFNISIFDISDYEGAGYSVVSNGFEDIWSDDNY